MVRRRHFLFSLNNIYSDVLIHRKSKYAESNTAIRTDIFFNRKYKNHAAFCTMKHCTLKEGIHSCPGNNYFPSHSKQQQRPQQNFEG